VLADSEKSDRELIDEYSRIVTLTQRPEIALRVREIMSSGIGPPRGIPPNGAVARAINRDATRLALEGDRFRSSHCLRSTTPSVYSNPSAATLSFPLKGSS